MFIRNLQSDSSNRLFVASMIEIAHSLNKLVVAEQVEDAGTLEVLRGLGIDLVQGFHLSRPSARRVETHPRAPLQVVSDFRRSTRGDVA
jgi:EAL domain-containing protein (putative c-di-GMP-specific phosphodiesterase class I)